MATHIMIDTLSYHADSLIAWLGYLDTYGADLMIAGEYASQGDYENALDILERVSFRRTVSVPQSTDLDHMIGIYTLLDSRSIASLTPADRSYLRYIAYANAGASSGVARAVLSYFKEYIPLPYYIGEQINFRSVEVEEFEPEFRSENKIDTDISFLKIYPNPAGSDFRVEWDQNQIRPECISVFNQYGYKMAEVKGGLLSAHYFEINHWADGLYFIMAKDSTGKMITGKLLKLRN